MNITDKTPDFVNSDGIKWWKHNLLTQYANKKDIKDSIGYVVETNTGFRNLVLINQTGIIAESTTLEGIGTQIDMISFINKSKEFKI